MPCPFTQWISLLYRQVQKMEQIKPDHCDRYQNNRTKKCNWMTLVSYIGIGWNISQISLKCRKSLFLVNFDQIINFLHFIEIWLMFRPIPMYETNAIQLHFLVRLFWYLSQWSGLICSIFCTRLYSKDIHCVSYTCFEKKVH